MTDETEQSLPISDRPQHVPIAAGEELDWPALERYLRAHVPSLAGEFDVRRFSKGYANLTYLVTFGDTPLVVRRPPRGRIAPGAHDMAREHRALAGLSPVYPKVPRPFAYCDDIAVIGSPFLVMEFREGLGVWDAVPTVMRHHADVGHRLGIAAVERALAELHQVPTDVPGLADLGRPAGFVARQVDNWTKRWNLVASDDVPQMQRAADLLRSQLPESARVTVLHNDFKLDNCQFIPTNPDVVSTVFDWDQATLGDPLVDLGILLNYWPDPSDDPSAPTAYPSGARSIGLPSRADIAACYADLTGADLGRLSWYQAFAAWKTAVVQQQLFSRFQRGETTDRRMEALVPSIAALATRSVALLEAE